MSSGDTVSSGPLPADLPADSTSGEAGLAAAGGRPRARSLVRRRRANAAGRSRRHVVSVTAEEEDQLVRLAEAQGVTVPRLLVESATAERGGETASERRELLTELFAVQRALGAVGNNLNQLTRVAHGSGEVAAELTHTLAAVRRRLDRLDDTLDGFAAGR